MSSGLPFNKKQMLLASGGLAAAYIGFKMGSHSDLSRYTVCEGRRYELDPMGVRREYLYTVCPRHLRYCCRNEFDAGEICCAGHSYGYNYSPSHGRIIGSLFGTLLMILGVGLVVYFCCIRRRPKFSDVAAHDGGEADVNFPSPSPYPPPPTGNVVTVGGYAPAFDHQVPAYPAPMPSGRETYPDQPPPPYSASTGGPQPPPYPEVATSDAGYFPPYPPVSSPTSQPSAPPPAPLGSGWGASNPTSKA
ncbi:hypothetical protein Aperf_G00000003524 [Anoplocephala perfoliata]